MWCIVRPSWRQRLTVVLEVASPQSAENGFAVKDSHPGVGAYFRAGCAAVFSRTPGTARVAHQFGQDGPAILAELGYDESAIQKFLSSGLLVTHAEGR